MKEMWDIYDENKRLTGRTCERGPNSLKQGEYHIVVNAIIMNLKNQILISQRAPHKEHPLKWECSGGSIIAGETSIQGILRELREELGLYFKEDDGKLFKEFKSDLMPPNFKEIWLFKKDLDISNVKFKDGEVINVKWVTMDEFLNMKENQEMVESIDLDEIDLNRLLTIN